MDQELPLFSADSGITGIGVADREVSTAVSAAFGIITDSSSLHLVYVTDEGHGVFTGCVISNN